jgi:hypothetical protein
MYRLTMSPEATDGGGTPAPAPSTTPPPASPVFAQPPREAGAPPIQINLPVDEYNRYRSIERELADFRRDQAAALEAAENARIKALADKGQVEEALNQQRQSWEQKHAEATTRYAQLEAQVHAERKSAVMAGAFNGIVFVGETPEDQAATAAFVQRSMADDFETVRDASGTLAVREKASGRPAAEAIRERLSRPPYTSLIAASRGGGSGGDGTRPPANGQHAPQPGSLEAIADAYRRNQGQYPSIGLKAIG